MLVHARLGYGTANLSAFLQQAPLEATPDPFLATFARRTPPALKIKMMHPERQAYVEEEPQVRISSVLVKSTQCLPYCTRRISPEPPQCTHYKGRPLTESV